LHVFQVCFCVDMSPPETFEVGRVRQGLLRGLV